VCTVLLCPANNISSGPPDSMSGIVCSSCQQDERTAAVMPEGKRLVFVLRCTWCRTRSQEHTGVARAPSPHNSDDPIPFCRSASMNEPGIWHSPNLTPPPQGVQIVPSAEYHRRRRWLTQHRQKQSSVFEAWTGAAVPPGPSTVCMIVWWERA